MKQYEEVEKAYDFLKSMDPKKYDSSDIKEVLSGFKPGDYKVLYSLFAKEKDRSRSTSERHIRDIGVAAFGCDPCMGDFYDNEVNATYRDFGKRNTEIDSIVNIIKQYEARDSLDSKT